MKIQTKSYRNDQQDATVYNNLLFRCSLLLNMFRAILSLIIRSF